MKTVQYIIKSTPSEARGLKRWLDDNSGELKQKTHLEDPRLAHPVTSLVAFPIESEAVFLEIAQRSRWIVQINK